MKSRFIIDDINKGEQTKIGDTQVIITDFSDNDSVLIEIRRCEKLKDYGDSEWESRFSMIKKEELSRAVRSIL